MKVKCIIIDDEQYAIEGLAGYVEKMPGLMLHATYSSALTALNQIKIEDQVDFIFMDIEMPEISGLELAKRLRDKTRFLIFTTGHPSYALDAFDVHADQYLLKPITFSKFATTVDFILNNVTGKPTPPPTKKSKLKFIKADNKNSFHLIDANEVLYIAAAKNYSIIYTTGEQFVTHTGLNQVEAAMDESDFIRVNKSTVIAKKAIRKVEGHKIILKNDKDFQLGDFYKTKFKVFLNEYMLSGK